MTWVRVTNNRLHRLLLLRSTQSASPLVIFDTFQEELRKHQSSELIETSFSFLKNTVNCVKNKLVYNTASSYTYEKYRSGLRSLKNGNAKNANRIVKLIDLYIAVMTVTIFFTRLCKYLYLKDLL